MWCNLFLFNVWCILVVIKCGLIYNCLFRWVFVLFNISREVLLLIVVIVLELMWFNVYCRVFDELNVVEIVVIELWVLNSFMSCLYVIVCNFFVIGCVMLFFKIIGESILIINGCFVLFNKFGCFLSIVCVEKCLILWLWLIVGFVIIVIFFLIKLVIFCLLVLSVVSGELCLSECIGLMFFVVICLRSWICFWFYLKVTYFFVLIWIELYSFWIFFVLGIDKFKW